MALPLSLLHGSPLPAGGWGKEEEVSIPTFESLRAVHPLTCHPENLSLSHLRSKGLRNAVPGLAAALVTTLLRKGAHSYTAEFPRKHSENPHVRPRGSGSARLGGQEHLEFVRALLILMGGLD